MPLYRLFLHSLYLQLIVERSFGMTCQRLVFSNFLYLLLENGGAFDCFPESGTNADTPRLKVAEAEGLVYFWSVSPMVLGGVGLYLTAEFTHSHAVLPVSPYSCMAPPSRRPATAWTYPSTATVRTCI